jgi:hypothetical protein
MDRQIKKQKAHEYYLIHKEEIKQKNKYYNLQHPEKVKQWSKKYRNSEKGKKFFKERDKLYKYTPQRIEWTKKYVRSDKHKNYNKQYSKDNQEIIREKDKRFNKTIKGILNWLKKNDRYKFGFIHNELNITLIKEVNERDKVCPYCKKEFDLDLARKDFHYDHINPFKQLSKNNIVRCCHRCNQSKLNADLLQWMNFKKYEITESLKALYLNAYL